MPHIRNKNLEIGSALASTMFWRLKKVLISIVWGDMFPTQFIQFFKMIIIKDNKEFSLKYLVVPEGVIVTKFLEGTRQRFTLSDVFDLELSNGVKMNVLFEDEVLIKSLYTDLSFYSAVGQEFCLIFDIFYAKSGTEAVAESFFRVVDKQEMEGGQSTQVLMNHAKVDWCLLSVIQCDSALNEMANMYINGNNEDRGLNKHHIPVFRDRRSWQKHEAELSKLLKHIITSCLKLPFLL
jgi:hypothetical protein